MLNWGKVGNANMQPSYPKARSTPTVDGERLYALGSDGDLACLEIATGKVLWQKSLRHDFAGHYNRPDIFQVHVNRSAPRIYTVHTTADQLPGAQPSVLAGHSLGEYTALVASGALDFAAALPMERYRAEVMQGAVGEGATFYFTLYDDAHVTGASTAPAASVLPS